MIYTNWQYPTHLPCVYGTILSPFRTIPYKNLFFL